MATEAIHKHIDATPSSQLKHAAIGFLVGVVFALFFGFFYVEELKLQVVDDIHYERTRIGNIYLPLLDKLSEEDLSEWVRELPDQERDVMCNYLPSICTETTEE